jgi:hypothetical protein
MGQPCAADPADRRGVSTVPVAGHDLCAGLWPDAGKWLRAGQSPLRFLRQPPLAWALGVGGLFGYHFCYFLAMRLARRCR